MATAGSSPAMRYAYLDCEDAAKWAGHERMAYTLLHPGAAWAHYRCYAGELPPLEGLSARFDGLLISGSHYSAYEDLPWIRQLEAFLRAAVAQHPAVRIIGMCFGCQVLAAALGGRVGKNASGRFVLGVETLRLLPPLRDSVALRLAAADVASGPAGDISAARGSRASDSNSSSSSSSGSQAAAGQPPGNRAAAASTADGGTGDGDGASSAAPAAPAVVTLRLIESHGDCVLELPPGAVLLAESDTAPVEMFALPGGNVLAVQGHAELTAADTLEKIHTAVAAAGRLSAEEAAESERSLREDGDDAALVVQLYRRFMEAGLPEAAAASNAAAGRGSGGRTAAAADAAAAAGEPGAAEAARQAAGGAGGAESAGAGGAVQQEGTTGSVASAGSSPGGFHVRGSPSAAPAAAALLLEHLQLAVGAELGRGVAEQQLQRQCNEAAAARYQQMGEAAAAAREALEGLLSSASTAEQSQHEVPPTPGLLDELEAQVGALEATVEQLDEGSRRLEARLAAAAGAAAPAAATQG